MRKATDFIIIHCAATKPSMDIGAKEIDRWHRERGWLGIGYHWVIRRDGTVERGRDVDQVGAHAKGFNDKSVGICLVGGIHETLIKDRHPKPEANFTPEQWEALDVLVDQMLGMYPGAEVIGHNEVADKACPAFNVQDWLADRKVSEGERDGRACKACSHCSNCGIAN